MREAQKGIDSFVLKLSAAGTMLCSHIYKGLLAPDARFLFLDILGRIAFPVFCFLLVEGFCHTSNRRNYLLRLWIFAFLSEVPFDLCFFGTWMEVRYQNVMFTMGIGILVLCGLEKWKDWRRMGVIAGGMFAAWLLRVDYSFFGIAVIVCFYLVRGMKRESMYLQAALQLASSCLYGWIQMFAVLALPLLYNYNGKRGRSIKYAFYLFYPLHLLAIAACRRIL